MILVLLGGLVFAQDELQSIEGHGHIMTWECKPRNCLGIFNCGRSSSSCFDIYGYGFCRKTRYPTHTACKASRRQSDGSGTVHLKTYSTLGRVAECDCNCVANSKCPSINSGGGGDQGSADWQITSEFAGTE